MIQENATTKGVKVAGVSYVSVNLRCGTDCVIIPAPA